MDTNITKKNDLMQLIKTATQPIPSQSLEFQIEYADKYFQVSFESESPDRNMLMNVSHDGFSLDTVDIRPEHPELYRVIKNQMHKEAMEYWDKYYSPVNNLA